MNKKVAVISSAVVLVLVFAVIVITALLKHNMPALEYAEDEIIVISRTVNFSEGYQDEGIFTDAQGRVFEFSFTMANESMGTGPQFMKALKAIQKNCTPMYTYDEEVIEKVKEYSAGIDFAEEFETKNVSCDAGERTLSVFDGSGMTVCRVQGDYEGGMKSRAAQKFLAYYDDTMLPELANACEAMTQEEYLGLKTYFYSGATENMQSLPTGYCGTEGMFVITSQEDVRAYEELLRKEIFDWEGEEFHLEDYVIFEPDNYVYFVQQINTYGGRGKDIAGFAVQNGSFRFLSIPAEPVSEDEPVPEIVEGSALIAAVPREVAGWFTEPETGTFYYYPETGAWMSPQ